MTIWRGCCCRPSQIQSTHKPDKVYKKNSCDVDRPQSWSHEHIVLHGYYTMCDTKPQYLHHSL